MEEIIRKLQARKNKLQKECWNNKIRMNEINTIIDLLKKEQTECKSECSIDEDKSNCEYRRFNIEDLETRKKFESLFEKELITHEDLVFIISTFKLLLSNN